MNKKGAPKKANSPYTSQYIGVSLCRISMKWVAKIGYDKGNKKKQLGCFNTEREAAIAYDKAAIQMGKPTNILKPANGKGIITSTEDTAESC